MAATSENVPAKHGAQDEVTADAEDDHVSDTNKPAPHAMGSSVGIVVGCADGKTVGCELGCELGCIVGLLLG